MFKFFRRFWFIAKRLVMYLPYKCLFKSYNISDIIINPIYITPKYIELGSGVYIGHHSRIEGVSRYNDKSFMPIIKIGDGSTVQQGLYLTCANRIVIGKNTAIAANVTITDINHPYDDINLPIENHDIAVSEVTIGNGCKIYNNVVILPGVHIGNHVTIGANSVVNSDIPDYCVVAGAPARIIKQYDINLGEWVKV